MKMIKSIQKGGILKKNLIIDSCNVTSLFRVVLQNKKRKNNNNTYVLSQRACIQKKGHGPKYYVLCPLAINSTKEDDRKLRVHNGTHGIFHLTNFVTIFWRPFLSILLSLGTPTGLGNVENGAVADSVLHVVNDKRYPDAARGRIRFREQVNHFLVYDAAVVRETSDQ